MASNAQNTSSIQQETLRHSKDAPPSYTDSSSFVEKKGSKDVSVTTREVSGTERKAAAQRKSTNNKEPFYSAASFYMATR